MRNVKLLVGTPANSQTVTLSYLNSMINLQEWLLRNGGAFEIKQTASMFLPKARNVLTSLFHERKEFSHLLFVDSDMGFRPALIEKMINYSKPVVGVIYPHRSVNFANVAAVASRIKDISKIERLAATYATTAVVRSPDGSIKVDKGFVEVAQLGTGILLISRDAVDQIAKWSDVVAEDKSSKAATKTLLQCFMPILDENGVMLSEDISFSKKWIDSGQKLWACVDEEIIHTGLQDIKGRYLDFLRD